MLAKAHLGTTGAAPRYPRLKKKKRGLRPGVSPHIYASLYVLRTEYETNGCWMTPLSLINNMLML